jgi:hypothetical protein
VPAEVRADAFATPQPIISGELPSAPFDAASISRRLRRVGRGTMLVGALGAALFVGLLIPFETQMAYGLLSVQSGAVRDALFRFVPIGLTVFFVVLAALGRRLWVKQPPANSVRRALKNIRVLLVVGMPLCLIGGVIGLLGRELPGVLAVGLPQAAAFVGCAVVAGRVRDLLADLSPRWVIVPAAAPALATPAEPRAVLPVDAIPTASPVPATAGSLQYANARDDETRDFLRLFDLLSIFAAVIYGMQIPGLADATVESLGRLTPGGIMINSFDVVVGLTTQLVQLVALVVAVGWALWGPVYVAFGAVFYRTALGLATCDLAAAVLSTGLAFYARTSANVYEGGPVNWLEPTLSRWLLPAVMLFCLTRARVRRTFAKTKTDKSDRKAADMIYGTPQGQPVLAGTHSVDIV